MLAHRVVRIQHFVFVVPSVSIKDCLKWRRIVWWIVVSRRVTILSVPRPGVWIESTTEPHCPSRVEIARNRMGKFKRQHYPHVKLYLVITSPTTKHFAHYWHYISTRRPNRLGSSSEHLWTESQLWNCWTVFDKHLAVSELVWESNLSNGHGLTSWAATRPLQLIYLPPGKALPIEDWLPYPSVPSFSPLLLLYSSLIDLWFSSRTLQNDFNSWQGE